MPILTQDIKLLQSAVMADTSDGGGAMTGTVVVDGASNNLFPDTSTIDRAIGRCNLRKVFGVAQTTDRDTLMGAHAIITSAPADPMVACALMRTTHWADNRDAARQVIESYLVKGAKYSARIYDTHYAGALQLKVVSFVEAPAPTGGDAIVIRNPDSHGGQEQYIRVLRVSSVTQNIAVLESGNTVVLPAIITTCELGQPLAWDVYGPPATRVFDAGHGESDYAILYTTVVASGAKFYGIKPLSVAGAVDDLSVVTAGGIYSPLVPAATVETPIIDKFPLITRQSVLSTSLAAMAPPALSFHITANAVLTAPTPITARSVVLVHGTTIFRDDFTSDGLYQGSTKVATIDYFAGTITFNSDCADYGTHDASLNYRPASRVGATAYSTALKVTIANQGLAYTNTFNPHPGPGSFTLSYMAQGRWYELTDNMVGKLSGSDSSYGVGTINYSTGSMAVTLGAIPDVNSPIIAQWGDSASASTAADLPAHFGLQFPMDARAKLAGISVTWSQGASNYTATGDANGVLSGDGTGSVSKGVLTFCPNIFPSGDVTIHYVLGPTLVTAATHDTDYQYTLTDLPVCPGTFRGRLFIAFTGNDPLVPGGYADIWDVAGVLYVGDPTVQINRLAVGTINYTTGVTNIVAHVTKLLQTSVPYTGTGWIGANQLYWNHPWETQLDFSLFTVVGYGGGTSPDTAITATVSPAAWTAQIPDHGLGIYLPESTAFLLGDSHYTCSGSTVRKGWDITTGLPSAANAGFANSAGVVSITVLPANHVNTVTWYNAALDTSSKKITSGIFRTESAPLKTGDMQLSANSLTGSADDNGDFSGDFTGQVDWSRGVAKWVQAGGIDPSTLSYNAVFLQYLPLDPTLLGLDTARLPLDGKVPIYRTGDLVVIHNTLTYTVANPLVKDTVYDLGRTRIASVRVKDALGALVPDTLYTVDLNLGHFSVPTSANISSYSQPLHVEHRIEDMLLCSKADISGKLSFTRGLTHNFPAGTSFVSSAMPFGDLFARAYTVFSQGTWTGVWSDLIIGSTIIPQFNTAIYPIVVTNEGAIKERWSIIFTNTTTFNVIGEFVGQIATGNTGTDCHPANPATGLPYFTIPSAGWGAGWSAGNVLRFDTDTAGTPFWVVRTVLQGPATVDSDQFTLAFRGDVDRP